MTIVGLGNWASSLAHALRSSPIWLRERVHARPGRSVATKREPKPMRDPTRGRVQDPVPLEAASLDARVLWLCVPDSAIAATAQRIVERRPDLSAQIVLHSSGALNRDELAAAAAAGAGIASVHPLMSFPSRRPMPLTGVPFGVETGGIETRGVEADEPSLRRTLFHLVRQLGGSPFAVPSQGKALYHAAGMFASPLLTSLLSGAAACLHVAGLDERDAERLLGPIAATTVANIIRQGMRQSLSGPLARGDTSTVKLHLQALQPHPLLASVYRSLAALALETLPTRDTEALLRLLTAKTKGGRPPQPRPVPGD